MKKFIVLLIFSLCISTQVSAQTLSETQIRQEINKVASQMKSMQCDFTQTKNLKMLNDKLVSKGKMYYQQSNKLRWEYVTPYAYIFLQIYARAHHGGKGLQRNAASLQGGL